MKTTATYLRCDNRIRCTELADLTELGVDYAPGWYNVRVPDADGKLNGGGFDFCSITCLNQWSRDRKEAIGEKTNYSKQSRIKREKGGGGEGG